MDSNNIPPPNSNSKKKKKYGKLSDVIKFINLRSHTIGEDCRCKRFKCFMRVPESSRQKIIQSFNLLNTVDEQNIYLCGLITTVPIKQRRPRQQEEDALLHDASFRYRVRILNIDGQVEDVQICKKAFMSLHGIGRKKLAVLQKSLKLTGDAPKDQRGKHTNRPHKLSVETRDKIICHIGSFKGRKSHYSLHDSAKLYLPEELNIKKMFNMFREKFPNEHVSYETYRTIFSMEFNISFGYPRSDTCSNCDEYLAKIKSLEAEKLNLSQTEDIIYRKIDRDINMLNIQNRLHKIKAEQFYRRKRDARTRSQKSVFTEAVCIDFAKNLPVPNISTSDVYYKRQLSTYAFNVHILSTSQSIFYMYPETVAKKGSDDVCSLLHNFLYNYLNPEVRQLEIFCDSCGGQNKNYTMFRFLHYVVHVEKRLDFIKVTFPIRGHSYMECDKDFGLINQKTRVELPEQWLEVFRMARNKPTPFDVENVTQTYFRSWTTFFNKRYRRTCPFPSRPIREMKVVKDHPRMIFHRDTYNGAWETTAITDPKFKTRTKLKDKEFELPDYSYNGKIRIYTPRIFF